MHFLKPVMVITALAHLMLSLMLNLMFIFLLFLKTEVNA